VNIGFNTFRVSESAGGIENTGYILTEALAEKNDIFVTVFSDKSSVVPEKCISVKSAYNYTSFFKLIYDIYKRIKDYSRDNRLDFNLCGIYYYALGSYLQRKHNGTPYGIMLHGNELITPNSNHINIVKKIKRAFLYKYRRTILENADILFCNSQYTMELCRSQFNCKNIIVVNPPIKIKHAVYKNGKKPTYKILSLGRIVERKGFQYVIKAMSDINRYNSSIKYYIAGTGPYEEELVNIAKQCHVEKNVIFLGKVSEEDKNKLYAECDFFLMPSIYIEKDSSVEGFGLVYIEANMFGTYVIGTNTGGIQDAISDGINGTFVKEGSSRDISDKIINLYSNWPSYNSKECINWANKFDASKVADIYCEIIEHTIQKEKAF